MADDPLVELLVEWEERRQAGKPTTAEELCPDDPVLCEQLRARIARRKRFAPVIEPTATVTVAESTPSSLGTIPEVAGYEIIEVIGHGGMGIVYKAKHLGLKRTVALKMILGGPSATETERGRFLIEAQAVARLSHPNIVQVYDVGEVGGRPYLAMEYLADGSLSTWLNDSGIEPRLAAEVLLSLADAVHHAHLQGIVHRDLKPANILLTNKSSDSLVQAKGQVPFIAKVADFGLAKRLDSDRGHTQTGAVLGSPSYMPPEQAIGSTEIGTPADVYSLGAMLYEMLTGRPPFRGASLVETLDMVRHADPIAPRHFRSIISRDLETICLKCLEKNPARRYESAATLADDLRRFLAGDEITAKADGLGSQIFRLLGRTEVDHRAAEFARTVIWLAPLGVVPQTILYLGWRDSLYYPQLVLGTLLCCLVVMVFVMMCVNQTWIQEIPSAQRRHQRTVWLSNFIACIVGIFVISWTAKPERPDEFMVIIPILVTITGTSILSSASFAGWMYLAGFAFYTTAVIMALDLSLAGLELGLLMTSNILYQVYCMRRLTRTASYGGASSSTMASTLTQQAKSNGQ
jgi:serine/threonine protein kinase